MRYFLWISIVAVLLFLNKPIYASSDYILPYPSSMPGSKFYKFSIIWEQLMQFWHFGNFAQFKYNLSKSDKYLVEAKTLFEYRQYLLAKDALKKSNNYFTKANKYLYDAKKEGKNIEQNAIVFKNAALKHKEVLEKISNEVPKEFTWQPEKENPQTLHLRENIDQAIKFRESFL